MASFNSSLEEKRLNFPQKKTLKLWVETYLKKLLNSKFILLNGQSIQDYF